VTRRLVAVGLVSTLVGLLVVLSLIRRGPPDPYVITAIDYHFHDAHPTLPISAGRDLVVKNEGRNVHNVTIAALGYSRDVEPGSRLVIPDVAERFAAPGRYPMICLYHRDRGMTGVIVIAS
jgi:plastocyanin